VHSYYQHANPSTRIYWVAYKTGFSQSAVWNTLHEEQLYPFHIRLLQWLIQCSNLHLWLGQWFLHKTVDESDFLCCVLWTDGGNINKD
jgi:hypothetical protein